MNKSKRARRNAIELLTYYMKNIYQIVGLEWTADHSAEMKEIVDAIIKAAKEESK